MCERGAAREGTTGPGAPHASELAARGGSGRRASESWPTRNPWRFPVPVSATDILVARFDSSENIWQRPSRLRYGAQHCWNKRNAFVYVTKHGSEHSVRTWFCGALQHGRAGNDVTVARRDARAIQEQLSSGTCSSVWYTISCSASTGDYSNHVREW